MRRDTMLVDEKARVQRSELSGDMLFGMLESVNPIGGCVVVADLASRVPPRRHEPRYSSDLRHSDSRKRLRISAGGAGGDASRSPAKRSGSSDASGTPAKRAL